MTDFFITNKGDRKLKQALVDKISGSSKIDMLVGYFYWSGFESIYNDLKDKNLRILVGMDIQPELNGYTAEKYFRSRKLSISQTRAEFFATEKKRITESLEMEDPIAQTAFQVYLGMLKNGKLEIKRTLEPNHAKLYIFHNNDDLVQSYGGGQIITGSSNFTRSGLEGRAEINVNLKDEYIYKESKKIFDELWDDALPLLDATHAEEFEREVVEQTFLSAKPSPFIFYLRTLIELFDYTNITIKSPREITAGNSREFDDLEYQLDAIKEGIKKIKTHNGVIVADVVGLGKSIIASTIAHNLNLKTVVIAPPHLMDQWLEYSDDFNLKTQNNIYSSGKIEKAYTTLAQTKTKTKKLIIIDEAHKYRNEDTDDHKYLMDICRGNYVILLTATPYNNSPKDLRALLRLFQIERSPTIQSLENIFDRFSQLQIDYDKLKKELKDDPNQKKQGEFSTIAKEMKAIIEPVLIRRSRLDIQNIDRYKQQIGTKINFSKVRSPEIIEYELGHWEQKYINTLQKIVPPDQETVKAITEIKHGFKGVRYSPAAYIKKPETQKKEMEAIFGDFSLAKTAGTNLAKLMKNLLIRRFESSIEAFKISLRKTINTHTTILDWYDKGYVPILKKGNLKPIEDYFDLDNDDQYMSDTDELFQDSIAKIQAKGINLVPASNFLKSSGIDYRKDLEKDKKLLEEILAQWDEDFQIFESQDPKLLRVIDKIKQLQSQNPSRKILIYSSFADTVNYVSRSLNEHGFRVLNYTASSSTKNIKEIIRNNFDAGLSDDRQVDDYDILVATDAISEGYNLHRAGVLINYDIPYNPTRVIQRLGRINRINRKVFEELHIYNFFPTFIGKREGLRIEDLATLKMTMIHALLGEDARVLKSDETEQLQTFLQGQLDATSNDDALEGWEIKHRNLLDRFRNTPEFQLAKQIPDKTRIGRVKSEMRTNLVFVRKNQNVYFQSLVDNRLVAITTQQALNYIEADVTDTKSFQVSKEFRESYFASIPTFYGSDFKSKIATKFAQSAQVSHKEANSNWSKAENFVKRLIETNPHFDQQDTENKDYLDRLLEVIADYRALSQQDIKGMITLHKDKKGLKSLKELLPPKHVESILTLCHDIQTEPKTVVLIQEIQPDDSNFDATSQSPFSPKLSQ